MKRILSLILTLFTVSSLCFAVPTDANDTHEENWSTMSYITVPIYKILDSSDAYVIIYAKNNVGVGQVVIPKKWAKWERNTFRKLSFRNITRGKLKSSLIIVKKDGQFNRVILNVPMDKRNPVWGVASMGAPIEGYDKDTLEDIALN